MKIQPEKKRFYIQWHFIERCNLRCLHCYQEGHDFKEYEANKLMEMAHIMESTLEKWNREGRISLTGGEPFLRKDLLLKLLEFFENSPAFYWIGILTNGTLIDEAIADRMKKFSKLKEIQVSLDGATAIIHDNLRGEGNFSKSVQALKLLEDKGFNRSIMFTLHKQNRDEALKIIDLAEALKIDYLTIERIVPRSQGDIKQFYLESGALAEVYKDIYKKKIEIEKKGNLKIRVSRPLWGLIDEKIGGFCPAGFSSIAILHDGTVLPCRRLAIPIGNILADGLYKIWYTADILWKLRNKKRMAEKCGACDLLGNCGGCRAIAYSMTGDFTAADPQCWKENKISKTGGK